MFDNSDRAYHAQQCSFLRKRARWFHLERPTEKVQTHRFTDLSRHINNTIPTSHPIKHHTSPDLPRALLRGEGGQRLRSTGLASLLPARRRLDPAHLGVRPIPALRQLRRLPGRAVPRGRARRAGRTVERLRRHRQLPAVTGERQQLQRTQDPADPRGRQSGGRGQGSARHRGDAAEGLARPAALRRRVCPESAAEPAAARQGGPRDSRKVLR